VPLISIFLKEPTKVPNTLTLTKTITMLFTNMLSVTTVKLTPLLEPDTNVWIWIWTSAQNASPNNPSPTNSKLSKNPQRKDTSDNTSEKWTNLYKSNKKQPKNPSLNKLKIPKPSISLL
jgi:hypothetical protein